MSSAGRNANVRPLPEIARGARSRRSRGVDRRQYFLDYFPRIIYILADRNNNGAAYVRMEAAVDWNMAIDKNREALKRILAMLVAMEGLGAAAGLCAGAGLGAGGQFTLFPQKG